MVRLSMVSNRRVYVCTSVLASCQSLHALDLREPQVSDVFGVASCQSLHTLDLTDTLVR
jgi:hypothetical protein